MRKYKALNQQVFSNGEYSIVPIRYEDRYLIRKWRNEQLYHLRQRSELTREDQDNYFKDVISNIYTVSKPDQILFSYLKNDECIGYGGLVHINWYDMNAELSFIMNTSYEKNEFEHHWMKFLTLIEEVAFEELNLYKIFTFAFDLRPRLYKALESVNFFKEARLKDHVIFGNAFLDAVIHSKYSKKIKLVDAVEDDLNLTFKWVNDSIVRQYSITNKRVNKEEHERWFKDRLDDSRCFLFIAKLSVLSIGSFRLDIIERGIAKISYLLDPGFHKKGLGKVLLEEGIKKAKEIDQIEVLIGDVLLENYPSLKLFRNLGFKESTEQNEVISFRMNLK